MTACKMDGGWGPRKVAQCDHGSNTARPPVGMGVGVYSRQQSAFATGALQRTWLALGCGAASHKLRRGITVGSGLVYSGFRVDLGFGLI